jgi:ElaB/YqjD/DUF883 family membrane-anchored ribosome-binding protein
LDCVKIVQVRFESAKVDGRARVAFASKTVISFSKERCIMATGTYHPKSQEEQKSKDTMDKAKELGGQAVDKAKEIGGQMADKARDIGSQTADKAKDIGGQIADKAKEVGGQAMDKAKDAATSVGDMASNAVSAVGKKADSLTATAGADIRKLGDTLSERSPHEGFLGHASQAVAETLHDSGQYIEDAKLSGMAEDVTKLIKRNPVPAVLIGVGIGFILGRAMRI